MAFNAILESRRSWWRLAAVMFCAGAYAILSQILLLREALVAFHGNELTIGAILSVWMIIVAAGSLAARPLLGRAGPGLLLWIICGLLILLAAVLPAQLWLVRTIRALLQVPYGEQASFEAILSSLSLLLLPSCLSIGMLFPCACHVARRADARAVGHLYAMESLGSMLAGGLFTFVFVLWLSPWATLILASLAALLGAALLMPKRVWRLGLLAALLALAALLLCPGCLDYLECQSIQARWRAFGALSATSSAKLVAALDSRYQNLALIEDQGQSSLYGNGQVMLVFPDPISAEHKINFIMAQNPAAASVLLIGGNPVTDIPELLKYPLQRLVHVELDGVLGPLLQRWGTPAYGQALADPRYCEVTADAPRFIQTTQAAFDVIIIDVPEPQTIALNRFYTLDFYQAIRQRLASGGFMYTSVMATEDLLVEAASLSASLYRSLRAVFPSVLVSAGSRQHYFAGDRTSQLTFDRQTLFQRSLRADLPARYFQPEYFLNADEIAPDKIELARQRLGDLPVSVNTALRPVAAFYHLLTWSKFSGSRLDGFLAGLAQLRQDRVRILIGGSGLVLLVLGASLQIGRRAGRLAGRYWARGMLTLVIGATGGCGLALELILICIFQSLLGYIYARIGMIIAVYMLGLALGALSASALAQAPLRRAWQALFGLDLLLLGLALAIPLLANYWFDSSALPQSEALIEGLIEGLIFMTGWAGGAQFIAVSRLLRATGLTTGSATALANAADLFGAALSGLALGVMLLPLWGISAACLLLAALKGASLLYGISARWGLAAGAPAARALD